MHGGAIPPWNWFIESRQPGSLGNPSTICMAEVARNRPGPSGTNRKLIPYRDRKHANERIRTESFVCLRDTIRSILPCLDRHSFGHGQVKHLLPGNARQPTQIEGWRDDNAIAYPKNITHGTIDQIAVG